MIQKNKRYIKAAEDYFLANNKEPSLKQMFGYLDCNIIPCCSLYAAEKVELMEGLERMMQGHKGQMELFPLNTEENDK